MNIHSETDELAARLVLGDELMAQGDPRGERIVVQCELERGGFERQRGIALRKREREIESRDVYGWRDTPLFMKVRRYRRGVVDAIGIDVAEYVRDEEAIWKLAPELRHVHLHGLQCKLGRMGTQSDPRDWEHVRDRLMPGLASGRITNLGLSDAEVVFNRTTGGDFDYDAVMVGVEDEIAQWLVETNKMAALRGLELPGVTPRTLTLLATAPAAAQLDELKIVGRLFDEATFSALATTKLAPTRLHLDSYSDEVADRRVTESPLMSRVTHLTIKRLTDFSIGRQLRKLGTSISYEPGWVQRLASSPDLAGVEELVLTPDSSTKGVLDLCGFHDPQHLDALRVLRISAGVTAEAARALLRSPFARRLELIDFPNASTELLEVIEQNDWDGFLLAS